MTAGARLITPWGFADAAEEIAPGIVCYSTPSHGGYHLSPDRLASVRAYASKRSHGWGDAWYEEDCAAAIVVITFPQFFSKDAREFARRIVDRVTDAILPRVVDNEGGGDDLAVLLFVHTARKQTVRSAHTC
jgi:hypothetical protein